MKKRVACLISMLALCLSMAMPAFAAEEEFVDSIDSKGTPEIVPVKDQDGNEWLAMLCDDSFGIIEYVGEECLAVTSIQEALEAQKNGTAKGWNFLMKKWMRR